MCRHAPPPQTRRLARRTAAARPGDVSARRPRVPPRPRGSSRARRSRPPQQGACIERSPRPCAFNRDAPCVLPATEP
nr:MAG: hypothetical protein DIU78_01085 [Pseudomonadota bacterium]